MPSGDIPERWPRRELASSKLHLLELTGALLTYEETPEALEFRQSQNIASAVNDEPGDFAAGLPDLLEAVTSRANAPGDAEEAPASAADPLVFS